MSLDQDKVNVMDYAALLPAVTRAVLGTSVEKSYSHVIKTNGKKQSKHAQVSLWTPCFSAYILQLAYPWRLLLFFP